MTKKYLIYSVVFHGLILLLMTDIILHILPKGADKPTPAEQLVLTEIDLGQIDSFDASIVDDYSPLSQNTINGQTPVSYGKVVSKIVLQKLVAANVNLGGNQLDLILKISPEGKLIKLKMNAKFSDHRLQSIINKALIKTTFPANPDASNPLNYRVSLF